MKLPAEYILHDERALNILERFGKLNVKMEEFKEEVLDEIYEISQILLRPYGKFQNFGPNELSIDSPEAWEFYCAYDFSLMKGDKEGFIERVEALKKKK